MELQHPGLKFVYAGKGLPLRINAGGNVKDVVFGPKPWYSRAYWNTVPVYPSRSCHPSCGLVCVERRHCLTDLAVENVVAAVELAYERFR